MEIICDVKYSPEHSLDVYQNKTHATKEAPVIVIFIHGGVWSFGTKKRLAGNAMSLCHMLDCVSVVPSYTSSAFADIFYDLVVVFSSWSIVVLQLCVLNQHSQNRYIRFMDPDLVVHQQRRRQRNIHIAVFQIAIILLIVVMIVTLILKCSKKTATHPQHAMDIAKCIQFVHSHFGAAPYNADVTQIVLLGHSCGAHLCSLVTLNKRFLEPQVRTCIVGVVGLSGVYSFFDLQDSIMRFGVNENVFRITNARKFTRHHYAQIDALQRCKCAQCLSKLQQWEGITDAFPIFHTLNHETDPERKKKTCFLLVTAEADITLIDHAIQFEKALREGDFKVQHIHFPNTNHFTIRKRWDEDQKHIRTQIVNFIKHVTS